jgi:hypothetical protein
MINQYSKDFKKNVTQEYSYIRDTTGNEIEIIKNIVFDNKTVVDTQFVKYLNYDFKGNWIKRITYNEHKGKNCLLTTRNIEYY